MNIDFFNPEEMEFRLETVTEMILNYYKNIAFDRSLALQFGIGLMSVRTTDYSDGFCIWIDEATLYTPYYFGFEKMTAHFYDRGEE